MEKQSDFEFDFEDKLVTSRKPARRRSIIFFVVMGVVLVFIIASIATNITKYFTQPPPSSIGSLDVYVGWIVSLPSGKYYQIVKKSEDGFLEPLTVGWLECVDYKFVDAGNEIQQLNIYPEGDRIKFFKGGQEVESVRLLSKKILTTQTVSGTAQFQIHDSQI